MPHGSDEDDLADDADEAGDAAAEVDEEDLDAHIDAVCAAVRSNPVVLTHPSLEFLEAHFEDDLDGGDPFVGIDPSCDSNLCDSHLLENYEQLDGESEEDDPQLTDAMRLKYIGIYINGVLNEGSADADIHPTFDTIPLEDSNGGVAVLGYAVTGYSFTEVETEWHGAFASREIFRKWLRSTGWLLTMPDLEPIDGNTRLGWWRDAKGRKRSEKRAPRRRK